MGTLDMVEAEPDYLRLCLIPLFLINIRSITQKHNFLMLYLIFLSASISMNSEYFNAVHCYSLAAFVCYVPPPPHFHGSNTPIHRQVLTDFQRGL